MSDHRLRDAQRRAQAGDPGAAVRVYRERLRAGTLTSAQHELAAYLDLPGAREAMGERLRLGHDYHGENGCSLEPMWSGSGSAPEPVHSPGDLCLGRTPKEWAEGLAPLLVAALTREGLARVLFESSKMAQAGPCPESFEECYAYFSDRSNTAGSIIYCLRLDMDDEGQPAVAGAIRSEVRHQLGLP